MIEPEIGFGSLKAFFDGPAQTCGACEFGQRRAGGGKAEVIGPVIGSTPAAADENPSFKTGIARPRQADASPIV